ncbi:MAG: isoaspartyl peptidase/L-asparaginase [Aquimonas sp.]|nr:isoaspartyl peptidase/L-asparaginase [Aquimonas sp.]
MALAEKPYALVIHGGAGTLTRDAITSEVEAGIRADLDRALSAGEAVLSAGGTSLDAVVAAVKLLEDSPHFNAGHGSVFTHEGHVEMDASIMHGPTRSAGAVAGLRTVRNPIDLARRVMDDSPHVMLIGDGAERFAAERGIERVDPEYFRTERRWQQLQDVRAREQTRAALPPEARYGTVGAVALDQHGALAAATSTGGMVNKRWGRVGDVPVLGAGTWAEAGCAVSATGWGEYFIRLGVGHEICSRMRIGGQALAEAADAVILKDLPALGGDGGVIAMDAQGGLRMPFNTSGMYRGWIAADGSRGVAIFDSEADPDGRD